MSEVIPVSTGDVVEFVDAVGKSHNALVTAVHGTPEWLRENNGSVNVVYVESDTSKTDPYGVQIVRATSVTHDRQQGATGFFWRHK